MPGAVQNRVIHARLFGIAEERISARVQELAARLDLADIMDALPHELPLGGRQRLSLAVALIHQPELLILDEPASGVDPVARDGFWRVLIELARRDNVTIFISTHFMNEAERCDRISLMHAGRVLVSDAPASTSSRCASIPGRRPVERIRACAHAAAVHPPCDSRHAAG